MSHTHLYLKERSEETEAIAEIAFLCNIPHILSPDEEDFFLVNGTKFLLVPMKERPPQAFLPATRLGQFLQTAAKNDLLHQDQGWFTCEMQGIKPEGPVADPLTAERLGDGKGIFVCYGRVSWVLSVAPFGELQKGFVLPEWILEVAARSHGCRLSDTY